jgi:hypothetical protein
MFESATKPTANDLERGWFTLADCAAAFDMTAQGFHKEVRPLLSPDDVRGEGRRGTTVRLRGAIDAYAAKQAETKARKDPDPLMTGTESPALERYRAARASQEELRLGQMRDELIPRRELEPGLLRFAQVLRSAGDQLRRQCGADAAEILNAAVDDAVDGWQRMFPTDDRQGWEQPAGPPAESDQQRPPATALDAPAPIDARPGAGARETPERPARSPAEEGIRCEKTT